MRWAGSLYGLPAACNLNRRDHWVSKNRLEAFSDGVIAIVITIMVMQISVPEGGALRDLLSLIPGIVCYAISFLMIAIYWNNHHHLTQIVAQVNGKVLWSNLFFLFLLSLLPLTTNWAQKTKFEYIPVIVYASSYLLCTIAYLGLERTLMKESVLENVSALKDSHRKEWATVILHVVSIVFAAFHLWQLAFVSMGVIAMIWVVPELRIEKIYK